MLGFPSLDLFEDISDRLQPGPLLEITLALEFTDNSVAENRKEVLWLLAGE